MRNSFSLNKVEESSRMIPDQNSTALQERIEVSWLETLHSSVLNSVGPTEAYGDPRKSSKNNMAGFEDTLRDWFREEC